MIYTVVVSNPGDDEVRDIVVRQTVPAELDVLGVHAPDGVNGSTTSDGSSVSVVWSGFDLAPGESITLSWTARAARAGDFVARSSIEATADDVAKSAQAVPLYLAATTGVRTVSEGRDSIIQKRTVTRAVPVSQPLTNAQAEGSILPATGLETWPFVILGLLSIGIGALLWRSGTADSKLRFAPLLVLGLTLAACTSGQPVDEQASRAPEAASSSALEPTPEPTDDTEVLGIQIEKDDEDGPVEDETDGDPIVPGADTVAPSSSSSSSSSSSDAADTLTEASEEVILIEEVVTVEIPVSEASVRDLHATEANNVIGLEWSEVDGVITATSGLVLSDAIAEIGNSLAVDGTQISVTVRILNTSSTERLRVEGYIEHVIAGLDDPATLTSPISETLAPKEVVATDFTYTLPSGSYSLSSRFVPRG